MRKSLPIIKDVSNGYKFMEKTEKTSNGYKRLKEISQQKFSPAYFIHDPEISHRTFTSPFRFMKIPTNQFPPSVIFAITALEAEA